MVAGISVFFICTSVISFCLKTLPGLRVEIPLTFNHTSSNLSDIYQATPKLTLPPSTTEANFITTTSTQRTLYNRYSVSKFYVLCATWNSFVSYEPMCVSVSDFTRWKPQNIFILKAPHRKLFIWNHSTINCVVLFGFHKALRLAKWTRTLFSNAKFVSMEVSCLSTIWWDFTAHQRVSIEFSTPKLLKSFQIKTF